MSSKPLLKISGAIALLVVIGSTSVAPVGSRSLRSHMTVTQRLDRGEVVVGLKNFGEKKYVTGKVLIPYSIDKVWPVMVNPYEFENNIPPGMQNLQVLTDTNKSTVMKVTIKNNFPIPLPPISYTVKSNYRHKDDGSFIEFRRLGGTFKDFHGFWQAKSVHGGKKTEVLYSMYLDPGFYVPQWIIRKGVSSELPKTLTSLRRRVDSIYTLSSRPLKKSISAALPGKLSASSQLYASQHL